jgi:hypothetical protein
MLAQYGSFPRRGETEYSRYYGATATRSESGPHLNSVHDQHPCNFRPSPQAR